MEVHSNSYQNINELKNGKSKQFLIEHVSNLADISLSLTAPFSFSSAKELKIKWAKKNKKQINCSSQSPLNAQIDFRQIIFIIMTLESKNKRIDEIIKLIIIIIIIDWTETWIKCACWSPRKIDITWALILFDHCKWICMILLKNRYVEWLIIFFYFYSLLCFISILIKSIIQLYFNNKFSLLPSMNDNNIIKMGRLVPLGDLMSFRHKCIIVNRLFFFSSC